MTRRADYRRSLSRPLQRHRARVAAADEGRHEHDGDELWNESWYFDFAGARRFVRRVRAHRPVPNDTVWYWAYIVGEGRPLVAVRDHDAPLPAGRGLEVRAEGLWGDTPVRRRSSTGASGSRPSGWPSTIRPRPTAASGATDRRRPRPGVGDRPVRMSTGLPRTRRPAWCRARCCSATSALQVDGFGERDHSWGRRDWWTMPWCWTAGRLGDGTAFHASAR